MSIVCTCRTVYWCRHHVNVLCVVCSLPLHLSISQAANNPFLYSLSNACKLYCGAMSRCTRLFLFFLSYRSLHVYEENSDSCSHHTAYSEGEFTTERLRCNTFRAYTSLTHRISSVRQRTTRLSSTVLCSNVRCVCSLHHSLESSAL